MLLCVMGLAAAAFATLQAVIAWEIFSDDQSLPSVVDSNSSLETAVAEPTPSRFEGGFLFA